MSTPTFGSRRRSIAAAQRSQSLALLRHHQEGRLGYPSGRGPRAVVVTYAVTAAGDIAIRVPAYHELGRYADGEWVSFEVDEYVDPHLLETVTIHGTAQVSADDHDPSGPPEDWPDCVRTSMVVVSVDEMECVFRQDGSLLTSS